MRLGLTATSSWLCMEQGGFIGTKTKGPWWAWASWRGAEGQQATVSMLARLIRLDRDEEVSGRRGCKAKARAIGGARCPT